MSSFPVFVCVLLFVTLCGSTSLQVGTNINGTLAFVESVKLSSIPLKVRTKNVFYTGDKVIRGISAIDQVLGSKAKASITAGGVGSVFVNIKLKGERGDALNFQIQVFV